MGLQVDLLRNVAKRFSFSVSKILLFGFIFLLFAGNIFLGLLTIIQIQGSLNLAPFGLNPFFLRRYVIADRFGPGLDGKQDEAMFVYIEMKPSSEYQVVLYDKQGYTKASSAWTKQITNRLYIGQLQELSHLKEGTMTKAVPCSRVFSFLETIDETIFTWEGSLPPRNTDLSGCKMIFTFRFYPNNNNWNPFKDLIHDAHRDITIEWGIHIHNKSVCPSEIRRFSIHEVLTKEVEDDLINYTCTSACGDDANICDNAHSARFQTYWPLSGYDNVQVPADLYFAINDLKVADSCAFTAHFELSSKFCDEYWADVKTVQVPTEIQHSYPQFITIPERYRYEEGEDKSVWDPRYYCNHLWNNSRTCCFGRN